MIANLFEQLRANALLQRILGNAFWQSADRILRLIVGLAVGIWIARYLGPDRFGLLNFGVAFVAVFTFLAELGLQSVVVRDLVRHEEQRARIVASALALRLIGAAVAIGLSAAAILFVRPGERTAHTIVVVLALTLIPQAWDVIDAYYQARMHTRPVAIIRAVSLIVFAVVRVGLLLGQASLVWFAWAVVGEAALAAFLFTRSLRGEGNAVRLRYAERAEMRRLLMASWPMAISALSVVLYMRIDQLMLGRMLGDRAVGVFSAAVRISESWYFVPVAVVSAVAPALTEAYAISQERYRGRLLSVMRLMTWGGLASAIMIALLAYPVIALLYGPAYAGAAPVLALHAWTGIFVCMGLAAGPWFLNAGLLRLKMLQTLAGACLNIGLNLLLVPRLGVIGAALATLLTYAVTGFLANLMSASTRPMFRLQLRSFWFR